MSTIGTQSSPFFFGWVVIEGGRCGGEGWGCDVCEECGEGCMGV